MNGYKQKMQQMQQIKLENETKENFRKILKKVNVLDAEIIQDKTVNCFKVLKVYNNLDIVQEFNDTIKEKGLNGKATNYNGDIWIFKLYY